MKTKKRLLSILLTLVLVLGLLPGMSLTAYAASSGSNGGFNWTLDDDGKMTVTGSGALPGRFINQNGNIKSIVFDENCQVSGLAQYSIYWANNATEIIINSTADLTIAGSAIWYSSSGGDPVSITINAPKVTIAGSTPFFAYGRQLNITVNTNELIVYNGTMSYLGQWNSNNSFAYPANSTVYIPAGYVFTESHMQEQYDRMAQHGMEDMFWQQYGEMLTEGRDYTYNEAASSVALTSENAGTVFGGAQTSSSNAYTAPHNHTFTYSASGATITATCGGSGTCDITEGLTLTISAPTGNLVYDGTTTYPATLSTGYNTTAFPGTYSISYTKDGSAYSGVPKDAGTYTASVTAGTGDAAKTASVSYTVTKAAASVTKAPTAKTLTYTGSAQELVTAGEAEGGELYYELGTDAENPPSGMGADTSIPTGTEAGTYYVWYKAVGDTDHSDSSAECVTVEILAQASVTVTYKVVNGTWADGTTTDITEDVASGSKPASVPTGMKASEGYTGGAWDTDPAEATITEATTFTYTFDAEAPAPETEMKVIQQVLTEVPQELTGAYSSVEQMETAMQQKMTINGQPVSAEQTVYYDVELMVSYDDGATWTKATPDNFPAGGLPVTLSYPEGTNGEGFDFSASHMFTVTSERLGTKAGEVETPAVTTGSDGLHVTLKGLSPVAIAWVKKEAPATPVPTATPKPVPKTGDGNNPALWLSLAVAGLILISGTVILWNRKKRCGK